MPARYNKLDLALTCVVLVVPVTTLVIANTALLTIALGKGMNLPEGRQRGSSLSDRRKSILNAQVNKRSFIIIGATTVVYTLAQLPYLYFCFEVYGITNTLKDLTLVHFTRFSFVIMQSSCFVNPIIYFTTNKGFRKFVLRRLMGKQIELEHRGSIAALSLSRGESRVEMPRVRTSPISMTPKLDHKNSVSVIFNVRAYYGCYNLSVPRSRNKNSESSRNSDVEFSGKCVDGSEVNVNGSHLSDLSDPMDGNLLESSSKKRVSYQSSEDDSHI
ncbi:hypothetical protein ACHWQZ_G014567 [Mnemiopsis leidyi]